MTARVKRASSRPQNVTRVGGRCHWISGFTATAQPARARWVDALLTLVGAVIGGLLAGYFTLEAADRAAIHAAQLEEKKSIAVAAAQKQREIDTAFQAYVELAAQGLRSELDFLFELGDRGWSDEAFRRYDLRETSLSPKMARAAIALARLDAGKLEALAPILLEYAVVNSHLWVSRQWFANNRRAANIRYQSIRERTDRLYQLLPRRVGNVAAQRNLNAGIPQELLDSVSLEDLKKELTTISPQLQRDSASGKARGR
jgi:hypothetical protein